MLRRLEKLITLINNPKIYEQNFICIIINLCKRIY